MITNITYKQSVTTNDMKTKVKLTPGYGELASLISPTVPNSGFKEFKVEDVKVFRYALTLEDTNNKEDRSLVNVTRRGATALDNSSTKKSYIYFWPWEFILF